MNHTSATRHRYLNHTGVTRPRWSARRSWGVTPFRSRATRSRVRRVPRTTPLLGDASRPGELVGRARLLSALLLSSSGDRWQHTRSVARRAREAVPAVTPTGGQRAGEVLVAAAWLHDIGYAAPLVDHGFHPVDGAQHLRSTGWPEEVVALVAHHSGARFTAAESGLGHLLDGYDADLGHRSPVAQALVWADQTTGPAGELVRVEERTAEVLRRHGPDSAQARCAAERVPALLHDAAATEARLAHLVGRERCSPACAHEGVWYLTA
ncbi:HD domain-containing protein [Quadrisphaera sp. INWT6]|nr:HD domain-containing protein [Quadrisphaera sp. INWT6]